MPPEVKRPSWPAYALAIAHIASTRSEDPWLKVGAVVMRSDHSIASVGYNGAPSGVQIDWSDRDARRKRVLHAEVNALRYVTVADVKDGLLAATHCPCTECLKVIASYGIKTVWYATEVPNASVYSTADSHRLAQDLGINLCAYKEEEAPNE